MTKSPATFKELEHEGWERQGATYGGFIGATTGQAAGPLLDAAGVGPGAKLLETASGPGYGASLAAERGAEAIGVDFSAAMVAEARRNYPGLDFRVGDAEALDFPDATFDAVICAFGMLHMANPDKVLAEAARVLKPGGRFAFSVWTDREPGEFFKVVGGAIQAHADMEVNLPPAPPFFYFADRETCERDLGAAGFGDVKLEIIDLTYRAANAEEYLAAMYGGTVRTRSVIDLQTPEVKAKIDAQILENARALAKPDGSLELSAPAVVVSAKKG